MQVTDFRLRVQRRIYLIQVVAKLKTDRSGRLFSTASVCIHDIRKVANKKNIRKAKTVMVKINVGFKKKNDINRDMQ